ncbi:MAG: hypothetical protein J3K34DRAFT_445223, partial [Monoraphidium minutum]
MTSSSQVGRTKLCALWGVANWCRAASAQQGLDRPCFPSARPTRWTHTALAYAPPPSLCVRHWCSTPVSHTPHLICTALPCTPAGGTDPERSPLCAHPTLPLRAPLVSSLLALSSPALATNGATPVTQTLGTLEVGDRWRPHATRKLAVAFARHAHLTHTSCKSSHDHCLFTRG